MLVPNAENALIDIRKLTVYCLNREHETGKHKASVFESALDLTAANAEELESALLRAVNMSNFKPFDIVALKTDLPEENLLSGQVGTIVEIYNDGEAFEVEFVDKSGHTYGLLALRPAQLMLLHYEPAKIAA